MHKPTIQQPRHVLTFLQSFMSNLSVCDNYDNKILWMNYFVVFNVDQWLSLKGKSHLKHGHLSFPSLNGGK